MIQQGWKAFVGIENERRRAKMAEMVKCEDCVYMYHCERTYLGECDTGVAYEAKGGEGDEA